MSLHFSRCFTLFRKVTYLDNFLDNKCLLAIYRHKTCPFLKGKRICLSKHLTLYFLNPAKWTWFEQETEERKNVFSPIFSLNSMFFTENECRMLSLGLSYGDTGYKPPWLKRKLKLEWGLAYLPSVCLSAGSVHTAFIVSRYQELDAAAYSLASFVYEWSFCRYFLWFSDGPS